MAKRKSKPVSETRRMTIDELENLLNEDQDVEIEILPNGEVRSTKGGKPSNEKPLTMRDNLGGEYGICADATLVR